VLALRKEVYMRRSTPLTFVIGMLFAAGFSHPASASTDVVTIPVELSIQSSGRAAIEACVGEAVDLSGVALLSIHQTTLLDGSVLLDRLHVNPQGAVAIGTSTGVSYRLVGGDSNEVVTAPAGGLSATFEASLRAIGPGGANSFTAHILQHITVTPAGSVTALIDVFAVDCR
jgi:hypothetical protein